MIEQTWFICTIAREGLHNWEICKQYSIWGIPSNGRNIGITPPKINDSLIIYHAGSGIKAVCQVTASWKSPSSKDEAPWAGGIFRYGKVVPFRIIHELEEPMRVYFESNKIKDTQINLTTLRRGFGIVSKKDGLHLAKLLSFSHVCWPGVNNALPMLNNLR